MTPWNSIVGLDLLGLWRHISYHDNTPGPQKGPLNVSFCKLCEKLIRWPTIFISLLIVRACKKSR